MKRQHWIVFIALAAALGYPDSASAVHCHEIYLVTPDANRGGSIYLKLRDDGTYARDGYLPVGTIVRITERQGVPIRRVVGGRQEDYLAFTSVTRLRGFVRMTDVSSYGSLAAGLSNEDARARAAAQDHGDDRR